MPRFAALLLLTVGAAFAGPSIEIGTDGIRLGWRLGDLHPFISGDFRFSHLEYRRTHTISDSLDWEEEEDGWRIPDFSLGAGCDWRFLRGPADAALRLDLSWSPVLQKDRDGFTMVLRAAPLLEHRWENFVMGASWAPTLNWYHDRHDLTEVDSGKIERYQGHYNTLTIRSTTEVHARWEF